MRTDAAVAARGTGNRVLRQSVVGKPGQNRPPVPAFRPHMEPALLLRQLKLPPKCPEDNYEISDRGDNSDEEAPGSSQEQDQNAKHVPMWCDTYLEQLAKQHDIDPDTIFGAQVPACRLEVVFPDKLCQSFGCPVPKRKRGSSADWRDDGIGPDEVRNYKSRMHETRGPLPLQPITG